MELGLGPGPGPGPVSPLHTVAWAGSQRRLNFVQILAKVVVRMLTLEPRSYRAFGAKPQRTPCSVEALRKRAQRDGTLPPVSAVVDLYNAVSLRYALPIGGEDADAYAGTPRLVVAQGGETFDTAQNGEPKSEVIDHGEVIWRDDHGATCRRWNWRQGVRTRITDDSTAMWFILERLDPMPIPALLQAGDELIAGLKRLSPSLQASSVLLQP